MEKKYQVFVSSTYEDLKDERREVMQALLELDCIPAGMELFSAADEEQWEFIKTVIDECDYYLLIIGGRYGSVDDETGMSYTEKEYRYARESKKPIITFLPEKPEAIPVGKSVSTDEEREKLDKFKEYVKDKKMVKFWSTPKDLKASVTTSIVHLKKSNPAIGWIKGDQVSTDEMNKELIRLQNENDGLKAKIHTISTEAPEGTDKLQQGEDEFQIHYGFQKKYSNEPIKEWYTIILTWNEIFGLFAPHLLDQNNDKTLNDKLVNYIIKKINDIDPDANYIIKTDEFQIEDCDFQTIMIQLRSLGLIKHIKSSFNLYNDKYWILTPYGDFIMSQLLAIRKNETK